RAGVSKINFGYPSAAKLRPGTRLHPSWNQAPSGLPVAGRPVAGRPGPSTGSAPQPGSVNRGAGNGLQHRVMSAPERGGTSQNVKQRYWMGSGGGSGRQSNGMLKSETQGNGRRAGELA